MEAAIIGGYRVTGLIGQGGMGAVYAAEHALLGRPAAIKILLPDLSRKQDIVMRFFNEARAATAIRHPGIVEIYDFGWTPDGAAYIVMERLDGETLSRRSGRARFPWQTALAIVRQIAGALAAAHGKGIVHRDLKPENIFLVLDPEVPGGERIKLLDFGIAKLAGDTSPTVNVTKTGAVMGTPTYMAPEQCRGVAVDARADLYSLGCILFELCTGRPPFTGEGTGDVLAAHIHVPPPTLAALSVKVPPAVEQLVQRLLAKPPDQRVQAAEQLIRDIDAITTERSHAGAVPLRRARPPATAASDTTLSGAASTSRQLPVASAPRQGRRIAIVSASAALISIVVVALVMRRGEQEPITAPPPRPVSHATPPEEPVPAPAGQGRVEPATPPHVAHEGATSTSPAGVPPPAAATSPQAPATPVPAAAASPPPSAASPAASPSPRVPAAEPPPRAPPALLPGSGVAAPATVVSVDVDSVPQGAQILLGGTLLGKTPFHGTLPRRDHDVTLVVRLPGHTDKTLVVRTDQAVRERIKLVRTTPVRPRPDRDLSVNPFAN